LRLIYFYNYNALGEISIMLWKKGWHNLVWAHAPGSRMISWLKHALHAQHIYCTALWIKNRYLNSVQLQQKYNEGVTDLKLKHASQNWNKNVSLRLVISSTLQNVPNCSVRNFPTINAVSWHILHQIQWQAYCRLKPL